MRTLSYLAFLGLYGACGSSQTGTGVGDCAIGETTCIDNSFHSCQDGRFVADEACAGQCDPNLGCVECDPTAAATCDGDGNAESCSALGAVVNEYCDPLQGLECVPDVGCTGACSQQAIGQSYIGCEYYPTVTANRVRTDSTFAISVSNAGDTTATVYVEGGELDEQESFTVEPRGVVVYALPWVLPLKTCSEMNDTCDAQPEFGSVRATRGAYHLRSDHPVTVYQFNPLEYRTDAGEQTYSNDATLLLPTSAWGHDHVVVAGESTGTVPSFLTVTAQEDETSIEIVSTATAMVGSGLPSFNAGGIQTVTLNAGDSMQLLGQGGNFTGSFVRSDKVVQVIGGHACGNVPAEEFPCCCDHYEHIALPIRALSASYLLAAPWVPSLGEVSGIRTVVVTATEANTTVQIDPPQAGIPTTLEHPGSHIRFQTDQDIEITATKKILVAELMSSGEVVDPSNVDNIAGDPALAVVPPTEQFRTDYLFHAPTNYAANYVNVIAPAGAVVTLDGVDIPQSAYAPIGGSGYGVARRVLSSTNGNHDIVGDQDFGISVYGYGDDTSYWYVGGLNALEVTID